MKIYLNKYRLTAFMCFLFILFIIYPLLVTLINPIPNENELIYISAKIINADSTNTDITIELPDGHRKSIYFPSPLYFIITGKQRFSGLSKQQQIKLRNCDAKIYGRKIEFLFPPRFQAWKIDCNETNIPYYQIKNYYENTEKIYNWAEVVFFIFGFVFIGGSFLNDRKKP